MRNRSSQLNVTHSFTTNLGFCYLNTAAFADFAFVTQAFVFTTVTLPVLGWTKDSFTEQTITFWFQGSVVDGFRFFNLTIRPFPDFFRRSQADFNRLEYVKFHFTTPSSLITYYHHCHHQCQSRRTHPAGCRNHRRPAYQDVP